MRVIFEHNYYVLSKSEMRFRTLFWSHYSLLPIKTSFRWTFRSMAYSLMASRMGRPIKTFVFLDLETTGLPHMENNTTKITELSCIAVQADHLELGVFPRVHNKLTLCFNPNKLVNPNTTDITGLSNELLEHQAKFDEATVQTIKSFLEMNRKPICLVAHNGNRFDFPILRTEILKAGGELLDYVCVDSLPAFRYLDQQAQIALVNAPAQQSENVPFEFNDGFDEVLVKAFEDFEKSDTRSDVQKKNETTPVKQMLGRSNPRMGNGKNLFTKTSMSFKLGDCYTRLTSKQPIDAHQAESDVLMLLMCAATLGEKFVQFSNENAKNFNDIAPMRPGKPIGMA